MRKKQINNIVWLVVLVILISGLLAGIILKSKNEVENEVNTEVNKEVSINKSDENIQEIVDQKIEVKKEIPNTFSTNTSDLLAQKITFKIEDREMEVSINENSTVLDVMNLLKEENKLVFDGKNYPGLGFFVTEINGLKSGDGKNLMYDINGKEASLGVSSYVVKEGDIIEWKLK